MNIQEAKIDNNPKLHPNIKQTPDGRYPNPI